MKTQINNLVQGSPSVRGTSFEERERIALKVLQENPEELNVKIDDVIIINMKIHKSISGLNAWYTATLNREDAITLGLYTPDGKEENHYGERYLIELVIAQDMRIYVNCYKRRTSKCCWKQTYYTYFHNSRVIIL